MYLGKFEKLTENVLHLVKNARSRFFTKNNQKMIYRPFRTKNEDAQPITLFGTHHKMERPSNGPLRSCFADSLRRIKYFQDFKKADHRF